MLPRLIKAIIIIIDQYMQDTFICEGAYRSDGAELLA
jgi:hypothetical protein